MLITIITLFPQFFASIFATSIIARAQKEGKIKIRILNLRDFGIGRHKIVDDKPYGGGVGMVLRVDVLNRAISSVQTKNEKSARGETSPKGGEAVILLDPKGEPYNQQKCEEFSELEHLILVCGHYEGFDERIRTLVDYEISIGDYILSGGETAAAVVVDSITRLIPRVLKKSEARIFESFAKLEDSRILEYPQYTRPRIFKGKKVPSVLLSGNFREIEKYRTQEAKELTKKRRPDLVTSD